MPLNLVEADVRMFGAKGDGTTDDSNAFIQAIASVSANSYPGVVIVPSGRYKLTQGISLDVSKCRIQGQGNVELDFTGLTSTAAVSLYSSQSYNNRFKQLQVALDGIAIIGTFNQSSTLTGKTGLYLGHATYQNNSMFKVNRVAIDGFEKNIEFTDNAWRISFEHLSSRWGKHVVPTGLSNFGENINFYNCAFFDSGAHWEIGSGGWAFDKCSFDNSNIVVTGDANVFINQCHFERPGSSTSSGYRIDIQSQNGLVVVNQSVIVSPGTGITYTSALFKVADINTKLGLVFRDCRWFTNSNFNSFTDEGMQVMVAGAGRVAVSGFNSPDNFFNYVMSRSMNVLYNADAETSNLNGWTSSGTGGTASVDTVEKKNGTYSFKLVASNNNVLISQRFRVEPGQLVMGQLWWKRLVTISGQANIKVEFFSQSGSSISSPIFSSGTTTLEWANKNTSFWSIVPTGADYAVISLQALSSGAGTGMTLWVDDVIVNVV